MSEQRVPVKNTLEVKVSKYMSYLLRHNPGNLNMDKYGFVGFEKLLERVQERFRVDKEFVLEIAEKSSKRRFEIVEDKIRALYGHTIPVELGLREDVAVKVLYHGTTSEAASRILRVGLEPMKRKWVHLSPTRESAMRVGLRRTRRPIVLIIDAGAARRDGARFYKATDTVYLSKYIRPEYVKSVLRA